MAWSVMSDVPNPLFDANGDPASGYVLKAYLPGTTTSTSIAINSAGSSPQASITANAEGKWEVSGNEILPYIDRKHKWGIFANSTHASANTPFYMGPFDNVERGVDALGELAGVIPFATVAAAQAATGLASGMTICIADRASSLWDLASSGTANGWDVIFLTASGLYATLRLDLPLNLAAVGVVADGATDDTAAIEAGLAIARKAIFPEGSFRLTSQPDFGICSHLDGAGQYLSVLIKEFNGDVFKCDINGTEIQNIGIDGNGATYTGGGIRPRGYNIKIHDVRIDDTEDCPIIVEGAVGSNTLAATYLQVDSCFLRPTNTATTYAVRSTTPDDTNRPTARCFSSISGGGKLVDFSGMNYAVLNDSLGTDVKFDANCSKVHMSGNRITSAASDITIYGADHVIDGNNWGLGSGYELILDSTAQNVYFGPNNPITIGTSSFSSITDGTALNGPSFNNLSTELKTFTLGWYGSGSNPTLGNSTTAAWYKQEGRFCWATFQLVRGSTATIGAGTYSFQLPFESYVDSVGTISVKSSSGTYYTGALVVSGGSSVAYVYLHAGTAAWADADFAFSTNALVNATICYLISPT
jgi:hypothetical protein